MSDPKKNFLDDNAFKPIADIGGGKSMRLRVSLWNNCIQLGTKAGNEFLNLDLPLDVFATVTAWAKRTKEEDRNKNIALTCKKGRDNQTYGIAAFGVGDDGVWYIGGKDTRGNTVKHRFIPNVKFSFSENGQECPQSFLSHSLFISWFENINTMLGIVWQNSYKTADERAYKPNQGRGGNGGYSNNNNGGGYNNEAPAANISYDDVIF